MNTRSRAHRSFRGIPRFKFLDDGDERAPAPFELHDEDEVPIGLYEGSSETILVTGASLYIFIKGSDIVGIPFASMTSIVGPTTKKSQQIGILTNEGMTHELNISGGSGKFQDVYSFVHFLMRILEDNRRTTRPDQNTD